MNDMNTSSEQANAAKAPDIIRVAFDPDRTPRAQIEAAIAAVAPRQCRRHPDQTLPVDSEATVRNALSNYDGIHSHRWCVEFQATYERCGGCPHTEQADEIEVEDCAVGPVRFGNRFIGTCDETGKPVPTQHGSARLEADQTARAQFQAWLKTAAGLRCPSSDQMLPRRKAQMFAPFPSWAIEPKFPPCLRCSLERLGIAPDESGASFDNFRPDPPALREHLKVCRAFAAAPKGVLLMVGNTGTGKTHLAIVTMRELLRRGEHGLVLVKHRHFLAGHWQSLRPVAFGDETPASPLAVCQESPLLVYDELTATTDARASEDVLLDLFEKRIGHFKPSIITANLSREELEPVLGTRLHDRLRRAAFAVLEFGFESKRPGLNSDYLSRTK